MWWRALNYDTIEVNCERVLGMLNYGAQRLPFWIISRLLFFVIIAIAILIARWTEYSPLVQSVIAYVAMEGIALVFLLVCNTVDPLSSLGEDFSGIWDATGFPSISKYLGLNSWESRESIGEEGSDVDLISRRKEITNYLKETSQQD
jgi:hypothetical protein